jgi:hypothetical protein
MTVEQKQVDALLVTGAGRLLRASYAALKLRVALELGLRDDATIAAAELAEHWEVANAALLEVADALNLQTATRLAARGLCAQTEDGRLVH